MVGSTKPPSIRAGDGAEPNDRVLRGVFASPTNDTGKPNDRGHKTLTILTNTREREVVDLGP